MDITVCIDSHGRLLNWWHCCFGILKIAEEIRNCVFEETGLTCSAGVAPNRLLAKVFQAVSFTFVLFEHLEHMLLSFTSGSCLF